MNERAFIHLNDVSKSYGPMRVVEGLNLEVAKGEFLSLLGPSGSGKTTILMMLACFERASAGTIWLDGQKLNDLPPHKRGMGVVFQNYALFPHMTVAENVAFPLDMRGVRKAESRKAVAAALDRVRLGHLADRKPSQLSGGQQQRVALTRALVFEPKVILMDEPLGALDKKLREETQFELMDLQQELGLTFVIVTHDQEEAMTMSDRIAVMRAGRIEQVATPAILYEAPNSRYVADFIGNVSIVEGTVEDISGDRLRLAAEGGILTVDGAPNLAKGAAAALAVRPEKITLSRRPPDAGAANVLKGTVWDIAYLGDVTLFNVKLDSGTIMRATVMNAFRVAPEQIGWDEEVYLSFPADAGVILSA